MYISLLLLLVSCEKNINISGELVVNKMSHDQCTLVECKCCNYCVKDLFIKTKKQPIKSPDLISTERLSIIRKEFKKNLQKGSSLVEDLEEKAIHLM